MSNFKLKARHARAFEWFVVGECQIARSGKSPLRVGAAVLDAFNLPRGYSIILMK
jgi:hypothetical protein